MWSLGEKTRARKGFLCILVLDLPLLLPLLLETDGEALALLLQGAEVVALRADDLLLLLALLHLYVYIERPHGRYGERMCARARVCVCECGQRLLFAKPLAQCDESQVVHSQVC